MKKQIYGIFLFILFAVTPFLAFSQITLPKVLGDNMVLQQGKKVNIWGLANANETISVKFQKQTKKTVAKTDGHWSIQLDELTATKKPQQLVIQGKKERIVLNNILIGEVWLVSGQSNMEYSMNNHPRYAKPKKGDPNYLYNEYAAANNPIIRIMHVEKNIKTDTLPSNGWQMINKESLAPFSAIGYFFAKALAENMDIPVGVISTTWGGTYIETWTSEQAYLNAPIFADKVSNRKLAGVTIGERYDKMVAPMIPYSLKGFLWYQGEQNLIAGDLDIYADKQKLLIDSWRKAWGDDNLSFYYVQLAPYAYSLRRQDDVAKTWEALPRFWEIQTSCMDIPHTGMVVTTDLVDNAKDIHPSYKWIVAERLSRWALAKDYGNTHIVYSGPTFKKMDIQGDNIVLEFDNAGSGLTTNDGKAPDWFYIRDTRGRFVKANATIESNKIIIPKKMVQEPINIRFGWDELAMPNLFNSEGLPAIPFRVGADKML